MIKDILLLKPYLSAYYEATKLIVQNQITTEQQQEEQYKHEIELDNGYR